MVCHEGREGRSQSKRTLKLGGRAWRRATTPRRPDTWWLNPRENVAVAPSRRRARAALPLHVAVNAMLLIVERAVNADVRDAEYGSERCRRTCCEARAGE